MAIIEVKGLGKKYKGNAFYSLENATFTIEEGDIIGLVGKMVQGRVLCSNISKNLKILQKGMFFLMVGTFLKKIIFLKILES